MTLSTWTSFLLLLLSGIIGHFFYRKQGLFNPIFVFFGVWSVNLLIFEFDSYVKYFPLTLGRFADVWLAVSLVCFFLGSLFALFIMKKKTALLSVSSIELSSFNREIVWYISLILFILFFVVVMYKYSILYQFYGNPFTQLQYIRGETNAGLFALPFYLNFFTLPAYLLITNLGVLVVLDKNKKVLFLSGLTLVLSCLNAMSVGMRGGFLNSLLLFFCSVVTTYIVVGKKVNIRHYIYVGVFILLTIVLFSMWLCWRSHETFLASLFEHNYVYLVGPFLAYGYFLSKPWPVFYWGEWTFRGIYQLLNSLASFMGYTIFPGLNTKSYYAPIIDIDHPFNTTNYLTYLFSDFGYGGMVVGPFLLGFVSNYLFCRVILYRKLIDIQLMAYIWFTLILTFRGVSTNGVYFWVLICLIILQWRVLKIKSIQYDGAHNLYLEKTL